MDQLMVEVDTDVEVGDKAILFGESQQEIITVAKSQRQHKQLLRVLASVGKRVPRFYED